MAAARAGTLMKCPRPTFAPAGDWRATQGTGQGRSPRAKRRFGLGPCCPPTGPPGRTDEGCFSLARCGQVFGLVSTSAFAGFLLSTASQPRKASACRGVRSQLPLRGSPGFAPGSLLSPWACAHEHQHERTLACLGDACQLLCSSYRAQGGGFCLRRPLYGLQSAPRMLTLLGPAAFTPARLSQRLERLRRDNPGISAASARFVHFVDLSGPLADGAKGVLDQLLDYGPRIELSSISGRELFVVPRLGTISPWSSKATDIVKIAGSTRCDGSSAASCGRSRAPSTIPRASSWRCTTA